MKEHIGALYLGTASQGGQDSSSYSQSSSWHLRLDKKATREVAGAGSSMGSSVPETHLK